MAAEGQVAENATLSAFSRGAYSVIFTSEPRFVRKLLPVCPIALDRTVHKVGKGLQYILVLYGTCCDLAYCTTSRLRYYSRRAATIDVALFG